MQRRLSCRRLGLDFITLVWINLKYKSQALCEYLETYSVNQFHAEVFKVRKLFKSTPLNILNI